MLDAQGAIVFSDDRKTWALVDPDGRDVWVESSGAIPRAMAPGFIACAPRPSYGRGLGQRIVVQVLDRATGGARGLCSVEGGDLTCAATRDVLYARVRDDTVGAWALDGRELWTVRVPKLKWAINRFALAPGRLYGITGNGRTFCLGAQ